MKLSHRRPETAARESGTDRANGGWLRRIVRLLVNLKQSPVHFGVLIIVCVIFIVAMCVMLRM